MSLRQNLVVKIAGGYVALSFVVMEILCRLPFTALHYHDQSSPLLTSLVTYRSGRVVPSLHTLLGRAPQG